MQSTVRATPTTDLCALRNGLAALCHERTRVQRERHPFRHCPRDERHAQWAAELAEIERQRAELQRQQAAVLRRSREKAAALRQEVAELLLLSR